MRRPLLGISSLGVLSAVVWLSACSSTGGGGTAGNGGGGAGGTTNTGGTGAISVGGSVNVGGAAGGGGTGGQFKGDPKTCAEAVLAKTYIGCDFWPTVVANNVWNIFDFAVVVANAGTTTADIVIERAGQQWTGSVPANGLEKFYLPWVPELKGQEANTCGQATPLPGSVRSPGGAYHLTSTSPVTVYQFNALEYKGQGGPSGKSWGGCPGDQLCYPPIGQPYTNGCYSFSNDASLLMPTTALTGNYRVTGQAGWPAANIGPYFAVTGTQDNTSVSVLMGLKGNTLAGTGVAAATPGSVLTFDIAKGEVVEVVGTPGSDLSGALVQATHPVQVIAGMPCVQSPLGKQACDHIEESVFPAETWGTHYFVAPPTGPLGNAPGHIVKIYGNVDGTTLQYAGTKPANAPTSIGAGQVVDLGVVQQPFEISNPDKKEFAVGMFQLGAELVDPMTPPPNQKGDPAQSLATAVEQFRTKYVFLAPDDYDVSYVDIVMPDGAAVVLDGAPISATPTPLSGGYSIARQKLSAGISGAHLMTSDKPVGIQVVGYGSYTSYQYPGGLNLTLIAPPPPPIK